MKTSTLFTIFFGLLVVQVLGKTFPTDLPGNFVFYEGNHPNKCPSYINQTTFTDGPVMHSWKMAHNTIKHGEKYCNGMADERKTIYYNNDLIPDKIPKAMKHMLTTHGKNELVNYPLHYQAKHNNETYYVGYESVSRYCQDGSKFNNGTMYFLFRPWYPVNMPLGYKNMTFEVEWKYLIALPRYEETVCVYKAFVPGTLSEAIMNGMPESSVEPLDDIYDDMETMPSLEPTI